jgi:hypothetical protein
MQVHGVIARRLLVNYRLPVDAIAARLPPGVEPKPVPGSPGEGMVGVCLIRLESMRLRGMPAWMGQASENVAHRVAVRWHAEDGATREGVWIPRRHTASRFTRWGGRLVGVRHDAARFQTEDRDGRLSIRVAAPGSAVEVVGRESDRLPEGSAFRSLPEASEFFAGGSTGCSVTPRGGVAGVRLETAHWSVRPFAVESARSSVVEEAFGVPPGTPVDCALVMRGIPHGWHTVPRRHLPRRPHRQPPVWDASGPM